MHCLPDAGACVFSGVCAGTRRRCRGSVANVKEDGTDQGSGAALGSGNSSRIREWSIYSGIWSPTRIPCSSGNLPHFNCGTIFELFAVVRGALNCQSTPVWRPCAPRFTRPSAQAPRPASACAEPGADASGGSIPFRHIEQLLSPSTLPAPLAAGRSRSSCLGSLRRGQTPLSYRASWPAYRPRQAFRNDRMQFWASR